MSHAEGQPTRARVESDGPGSGPSPYRGGVADSSGNSSDPPLITTTDQGPGAALRPEIVGGAVTNAGGGDPVADGAAGGDPGGDPENPEHVTRPTKLIRIASMVRTMLDEVRRAPLDDAGRRALRSIHESSLNELREVLSPDLRRELEEVALPLTSETPSEGELRLAQAQLVGWLEGLFHGIQATLFTQQTMAQQQLEEMRHRRMLEPGPPGSASERAPGPYL